MSEKSVTAAVLLIGDELLSGRTRDSNLQAIAEFLAPLGVGVGECRTVPDVHERIVEALNTLRETYDYVFTTGGIGPTHDDITADAIAAAFGVPIDVRADALQLLFGHYGGSSDLTDARRRMARIPEGADLVINSRSGAPGFHIGNVFVLAGVPLIARAMLQDVAHRIKGAAPLLSRSVRGKGLKEGDFAADLEALAKEMPDLSFGSYPFFEFSGTGASIVVRGLDPERLDDAIQRVTAMVAAHGADPEIDPERGV
ncbi:MAG: molybdopterin-binding protein [Caulobacterales bacterium]